MRNARLEKHIAAAAAVAVAASANAAVVSWLNCNIAIPATLDGIYINLETQSTASAGSLLAGWDLNPYGADRLAWFNAPGTGMMRFPGVTTGSAGSLAPGTTVSSAASFGSGGVIFGSANGNWKLNQINYFAFRMRGSDNGTKYGFGTMLVGNTFLNRTITNLYYETTSLTPIVVVAIPAPGALALLGVAGLAGIRRRR